MTLCIESLADLTSAEIADSIDAEAKREAARSALFNLRFSQYRSWGMDAETARLHAWDGVWSVFQPTMTAAELQADDEYENRRNGE
jgi:hypothetical protein